MAEVTSADQVRGTLGKRKAKVTALADEAKLRDALYSRLFNTRDGKLVLADLNKRFYDNEISDSDTTRDVGKRDVLHFINRRVTQ